jgi:hypothetical protein
MEPYLEEEGHLEERRGGGRMCVARRGEGGAGERRRVRGRRGVDCADRAARGGGEGTLETGEGGRARGGRRPGRRRPCRWRPVVDLWLQCGRLYRIGPASFRRERGGWGRIMGEANDGGSGGEPLRAAWEESCGGEARRRRRARAADGGRRAAAGERRAVVGVRRAAAAGESGLGGERLHLRLVATESCTAQRNK